MGKRHGHCKTKDMKIKYIGSAGDYLALRGGARANVKLVEGGWEGSYAGRPPNEAGACLMVSVGVFCTRERAATVALDAYEER